MHVKTMILEQSSCELHETSRNWRTKKCKSRETPESRFHYLTEGRPGLGGGEANSAGVLCNHKTQCSKTHVKVAWPGWPISKKPRTSWNSNSPMRVKNMILEQLAAAICDTSQTKPLLIANSENRGQSRPSSLVFSIKNRDCALKSAKLSAQTALPDMIPATWRGRRQRR